MQRQTKAAIESERKFRERLTELGATLLEPTYLGSKIPHRVICRAGHECSPSPGSVIQGRGVCRICAGFDPAATETAFRARLAALDTTLLEPKYLGGKPHRAICAAGHQCNPNPYSILRGQGPCGICVGNDSLSAGADFRARLESIGATLLEPTYLGSKTPHRVICATGHECWPRPNSVQQGKGICPVCSGKDPLTAESIFRARLIDLGATLLEPKYINSKTPHRVICAAGHECTPIPNNVSSGWGICGKCNRRKWDVFYVTADIAGNIKLGVTTGDPKARLSDHRRSGFKNVIRLYTNLLNDVAAKLEQDALSALAVAGIMPIRGREYFPPEALPIILTITAERDSDNDCKTI